MSKDNCLRGQRFDGRSLDLDDAHLFHSLSYNLICNHDLFQMSLLDHPGSVI